MSQMVEVKTTELSGPALDWAVAKCDPKVCPVIIGAKVFHDTDWKHIHYSPSTDWAQGGPLIDKFHIQTSYNGRGFRTASGEYWCAYVCADSGQEIYPSGGGGTPLIAACRAIVAAKLGDTVAVPAELLP